MVHAFVRATLDAKVTGTFTMHTKNHFDLTKMAKISTKYHWQNISHDPSILCPLKW